jgi:WD40 repeat protein
MDICLKKHLIVTCGHDNTIRVWNSNSRTLEICESYIDEPLSVAFHPSGLHIVVGFVDKIRIMNVFSRNLKTYYEITIKNCREIKFSNGGHLFACVDNYNIKVFRFYTA